MKDREEMVGAWQILGSSVGDYVILFSLFIRSY
jgi:hypothetical protein